MDARIWQDSEYQNNLVRAYVPDAGDLNLDHVEAVCLALERDQVAAEELAASAEEESALNLEKAAAAARMGLDARQVREARILAELGY